MTETEHKGLPVHGYAAQSDSRVEMVNTNKLLEEQALRRLDELKGLNVDQRWLAIGRTQLEQAWMAINRSIFQPARAALPADVKAQIEKPATEAAPPAADIPFTRLRRPGHPEQRHPDDKSE